MKRVMLVNLVLGWMTWLIFSLQCNRAQFGSEDEVRLSSSTEARQGITAQRINKQQHTSSKAGATNDQLICDDPHTNDVPRVSVCCTLTYLLEAP